MVTVVRCLAIPHLEFESRLPRNRFTTAYSETDFADAPVHEPLVLDRVAAGELPPILGNSRRKDEPRLATQQETKRCRLSIALGLLMISGGCAGVESARLPKKNLGESVPRFGQNSQPRAIVADSPFQLAGHRSDRDPTSSLEMSDDLRTLTDQVETTLRQSSSVALVHESPRRLEAGEHALPLASPREWPLADHSPLHLSPPQQVEVRPAQLDPSPSQELSPPHDATSQNRVSSLVTRSITESEMLQWALAQSPVLRPLGLRILEAPEAATTIFDRSITASDPFFGPQAALAAFDSSLFANATAQNNDRVFNNATLGGDVQELNQDFVNFNAGIQKRTYSGATWDLTSRKQYDGNNRAGNRFPNYWETQLEAGVRQPLLRGAGKQFNSIAGPNAQPGFNFSNGILIARLNDRISEAEFEVAMRRFVRDLYTVYWDLKQQYRSYESIIAARDLAYRTWQSALARREANLDGGEANKEAQSRAKYYRYCREAEIALGGGDSQSGLWATERRLRRMIGLPSEEGQLLRPADDAVAPEFHFDFDSVFSRALANRTELTKQSLKVQQQQLKLVASKNFLLPQMDLIGRYRLRGFGDDLTGDGDRFSSAYQDFFSLEHQEWEFGLEMGVTAGRRQAHAAVRNATLQLNKERSLLAEQQRTLHFEIKDAISEVHSAYVALTFSKLQFEAAQDRLRSSQVLFESDKIQIEFLLDAQEELLQVQRQYAADLTRYSLSLVSISAQSGTLLQDIGIYLQNDSI